MKWFKHYSDASLDDKLCQVEDEYGYVGYGVYWKIIEICALQWDGKSDPIFKINRKKMKSILSINYTKIESILSLYSVLKLFSVEIFDNYYSIEMPKLLEIKDNHTRNLQVTSKLVSTNLPLEQNRTDKNNKKVKTKSSKRCVNEFDIAAIYAAYPRKVGKAAGIKKLQSIITEKETYDKILSCAQRYARESAGGDLKYIKHFSTWVNQESWLDEPDKTIEQQKAELDARLIELMGGE
jgi:hypothetical protein